MIGLACCVFIFSLFMFFIGLVDIISLKHYFEYADDNNH